MYNKNMIQEKFCKCGECGIEFERNFFGNYKTHGERETKIFCSYKCYNAYITRKENVVKKRIEKDFCC